MSERFPYVFEFGSFVLNPPERLLLREGARVEVPPKVFDLLLALVSRGGHLLEKEELLRTVWGGSFVEEGNVNRQISTLRRILGDTSEAGRYIETVPKRGYRFVAPVRQLLAEEIRAGASAAHASKVGAAVPSSFASPSSFEDGAATVARVPLAWPAVLSY